MKSPVLSKRKSDSKYSILNKFEVLFTDIYSITTREKKTDLNVGNEIQNEVRWNSRTCVGVIERQTLNYYEGLGPGEDCKIQSHKVSQVWQCHM